MTPTEQIRKPRFVVALSVALLGAVVAGFVIALPVPRALFGVLIVVLGMFVAGYAMLKLRPGTTGVLAAPVAVLITAMLSGIGGHSLWLTAFGATTSCEVTSVNTHVGRRSPTSYSNSLVCGSRRIAQHTPVDRPLGAPGDRAELVLDQFGGLRPLEPTQVTWWRNVLVPTAAVAGTVFVVLVLRRPKWQPGQQPPRRKTKLDRDFL